MIQYNQIKSTKQLFVRGLYTIFPYGNGISAEAGQAGIQNIPFRKN